MAEFPVGKAEKIILDILIPGNGIQYSVTAKARFTEFGIVVASKRVGRTSVPVVSEVVDRGGWNAGGDGDSGGSLCTLTAEQRAALEPYWKQ
jgi:hypothetical protein